MLCRSSRLFFSLQQAFAEHEIPVEILGLAGLLRLPEIVEVLAYARAVSDPLASVALAKILLGPRYRVGYKDLARVAALAKTKSYALRLVDEEEGEATPFLFAEALEHLDEVERLSDDGKARLEEFRAELAELRVEARKPVGEFLGEVVRRTGILAELDAHTDQVAATAAKRNLAAFMDQVHAFEPVEGALTLRAFLDYVDTVERMDKQEWSPVQPSAEDSVKVMTIHAAKGLEFDNVFVPGHGEGVAPEHADPAQPGGAREVDGLRAPRRRGDPAEVRRRAVPLQAGPAGAGGVRGAPHRVRRHDARATPAVLHRRALVRREHEREGRRASSSGSSRSGCMEVRHGSWDPGEDIDEETNPLLGYRERFVKDWPEPARPDDADEVFPEGWRRSAVDAVAIGGVQPTLLDPLSPEERELFEELAAERRHHAGFLREREGSDATNGSGGPVARRTVSVGGVIDYARCPKRFYWTAVRPLPRFSGPAARIGTEVHRWIERRASGQAVLARGRRGARPHERGARRRARQGRTAPRGVPGEPVRGRHPAPRGAAVPAPARGLHGGRADRRRLRRSRRARGRSWTGRRVADPPTTTRSPRCSSTCTAWPASRSGASVPKTSRSPTSTSRAADEVSHPMEEPDTVKARVTEALRSIDAGAFDATPGPQCTYCDFRAFCPEGKSWLAERRDPANASADAATS